jgi:hypothetical protein
MAGQIVDSCLSQSANGRGISLWVDEDWTFTGVMFDNAVTRELQVRSADGTVAYYMSLRRI